MKRFIKGLVITLLVLISLALVVIVGGFFGYSYYALPVLDTVVNTPDVEGKITVTRDDWGVPHIVADSAEDAYFAFGYSVAQDRLFQLEVLRRLGRGELSELVGESALPIDKTARLLLWRRTADKLLDQESAFDPEFLAILDAYLEGVNHYVATAKLPAEFHMLRLRPEPFTRADSLSILGYMAYGFAEGIKSDALYGMVKKSNPGLDMSLLFPGYARQQPVTVLEGVGEMPAPVDNLDLEPEIEPESDREVDPESDPGRDDVAALRAVVDELDRAFDFMAPFHGSNSWVLAPSRSESGGAILANDPHIGFSNPAVWYECHMKYGDYENYGVHLPLIPFPIIAHNTQKAWALTMLENDDLDLYYEELDENRPGSVRHGDEWVELETWTEQITVKGREQPEEVRIRIGPHGPLITELLTGYEGPEVALRWLYHEADADSVQAFWRLGTAGNLEEARAAAAAVVAPGLNISYADAEGNIAWWAAGRFLTRPDHVNAKDILDGASGDDDATEFLPFDENPQAVNPPSGVIVTSNNMAAARAMYDVANFAGYWQPSNRAARIHELLAGQDTWTLDELIPVQTDVTLYGAQELTEQLVWILQEPDERERTAVNRLGDTELQAYEALNAWDYRFTTDSVGATVFQSFYDALLAALVGDEIGESNLVTYQQVADSRNLLNYVVAEEDSPLWDDTSTEEVELRRDIVERAFHDAVAAIRARLGDSPGDWQWGNTHTVAYRYSIFGQVPVIGRMYTIGPFPAPGAAETVAKMSHDERRPYEVDHGASFRLLLDYGHYPEETGAWFILPTGNSGNLMDPHYNDQARMYLRGEYRRLRLTGEQIGTHKEHELIITR